jgi:hypothetical protein
MKKKYFLFVMIFIFIASTTLFAQTEQTMQKTRLGMGVAMGKEVFGFMGTNLTILDFPSFYLPIQFGYTFRVEPEFGFYRYDYDEDYTTILLGCGFFLTNYSGPFNLYYGARVGMYLNSGTYIETDYEWDDDILDYVETTTEIDWSRNDMVFSPTIGAECHLCKRKLSLGGEIQFNYLMYGKEEMDSEKADDAPKVMKTKTLFFIRWYFGE